MTQFGAQGSPQLQPTQKGAFFEELKSSEDDGFV